jgi:hypothetical protein
VAAESTRDDVSPRDHIPCIHMTTVSRRDRLVDLAALLLIVAGAAVYLVAATRLRTISLYSRTNPGPPGALVAADEARHLSYAGLGLVSVGACVGVVAAGLHVRRRTTA